MDEQNLVFYVLLGVFGAFCWSELRRWMRDTNGEKARPVAHKESSYSGGIAPELKPREYAVHLVDPGGDQARRASECRDLQASP
jgi:hypothetical protein